MAIQDYLNNDFEKFAAEAGATVENAVENTDASLETANKRAELRTRIDSLKNKIANLENQRKMALEQKEKLKVQRESLTDDEIVRMAKIKGIKDEDIAAYINGRVSQRSYQISKDQLEGIKASEKASKDAETATLKAKQAEDIRANTNLILELEQKITENSVKLSSGNKKEQAVALATNRTLMNQYENALKDYRSLNDGKEWVSNIGETDEGDEALTNNDVEIPEGVVLNETEQAEFDSYGADTDKKNALIAKKKKESREAKEREIARQKELDSIKMDLQSLGVKTADDIARVMNDRKLENNRDFAAAKARVKAFMQKDKEYKTILKLKDLWGK